MPDVVAIDHFSDVLCVWAYVHQARIDQLHATFGEQVRVRYRFCPVFGAAHEKLERGWRHRGGPAGYGAHVREVADRFGHVAVHADTWDRVQPRSSFSAHVMLCAVRHLEEAGALGPVPSSGPTPYARAVWAIREAFFGRALDIGRRDVQLDVMEELGLPVEPILGSLEDGSAYAAFADDTMAAREGGVTMSPTLVLNEGRQHLNGNVGYRVIEANVRELLHGTEGGASWC